MNSNSPRRWFLTGVCSETKSDYWHSVNEVLDPRPISETFEMLKKHYSKPSDAIRILKQGNLELLASKFKDCQFSDSNRSLSGAPTAFDIENHNVCDSATRALYCDKIVFIEYRALSGWRCHYEEKMREVALISNASKPVTPQLQLF